jgi:hypothetical protein
MTRILAAAFAAFALAIAAPAYAGCCGDCPEHKDKVASAEKAEKKAADKAACKCAAGDKDCKCASGKCECTHDHQHQHKHEKGEKKEGAKKAS